jgi:superfamily I DNA and RNA helicase
VHINAALQNVSTIKPRKKRTSVRGDTSRGAVLKEIEKKIANLDPWQRRGAIETPEAPQRIRGIAGSGKTIVLALKAAYLHAQHPDWAIAVTFQTRSLYQQFRDLIARFYFDQQKDEPDWSQLRVLHAWGSNRAQGVYSEIASATGFAPQSFGEARTKYGLNKAFEGICTELLAGAAKKPIAPIFDALLVDEAQDLPSAFFRLIYRATKEPKRLIWAYDELQNLGTYSMAPPEELFGAQNGGPLVALRNVPGLPHQDVTLPVCYRNTPWAIATAHALGFGVYRPEGLCQFFDNPGLWSDIGYEVSEGNLEPGAQVTLERRLDCSPDFFRKLLRAEDSVQSFVFDSKSDQITWLVEQIKTNLSEDELEPDDILVIFPNPLNVLDEAGPLVNALARQQISAHVVGVTSSRDEVFSSGSIAISGIYRAKGNEAAMVYALNSEYCHGGPELIRKRNILFTAITRSRAWVRICGCGETMARLGEEISEVVHRGYKLHFKVPTVEELENIRKIHRDRTADERRVVSDVADTLSDYMNRVESGDLSIEDLPTNLRERLRKLLSAD